MGATSTSEKNLMKNLVKKIASAFTLIELLVVMAIIALLVFVNILQRGQQTKDLSNAKQIGLGLKIFAGDNDGKYPLTDGTGANSAFRQLIPTYIPEEKIFY